MSRFLHRLASALPLLALLACKLGKDNEQTDRALPTPEPASTTPPSRPAESEPQPKERPKEPVPREPSPGSPASPASPKPTATPTATATATATGTSDAAAPAPAPTTADAAAPAPGADKATQCLTKCQASLAGCLSKPIPLDAGVPSLESMSACKKEFDDCRVACTP